MLLGNTTCRSMRSYDVIPPLLIRGRYHTDIGNFWKDDVFALFS